MPGLDYKMLHSSIVRLFGENTDSSLVSCSSHIHPLAQSVAMSLNGPVPRCACQEFIYSVPAELSPSIVTEEWHMLNKWLTYRGKWACFERQDSLGKSIFSKTPLRISIICGVFMRAHKPDNWCYTATKLGRAFWRGESFSVCLFFEGWLMYILMCYRNVLYLLNCKLLFRLAIVVLLGCCGFKPNVTCERIHVCQPIAILQAAGAW